MQEYMSVDSLKAGLKFREDNYEEHLPEEQLLKGISEGKLLRGRLGINRLDPTQGTIRIFEIDQDVCIIGPENINRAVNFDTVAVKLLGESGSFAC